MAFNIIAVGFEGKAPSDDTEDLLKYAGFDRATSGKCLWGQITQYEVFTKVEGAVIRIFRVLEPDIESPNVAVVFPGALELGPTINGTEVNNRVALILEVIKEIRAEIDFPETLGDIESALEDGIVCSVLLGAAPCLERVLAETNRANFKVIEGGK
jgi:hypothetical protein